MIQYHRFSFTTHSLLFAQPSTRNPDEIVCSMCTCLSHSAKGPSFFHPCLKLAFPPEIFSQYFVRATSSPLIPREQWTCPPKLTPSSWNLGKWCKINMKRCFQLGQRPAANNTCGDGLFPVIPRRTILKCSFSLYPCNILVILYIPPCDSSLVPNRFGTYISCGNVN